MDRSRLTRNLVIVLLLSSGLSIVPAASSQQFTTTTFFATSSFAQTLTSSSSSIEFTTSTGSGAAPQAVTFRSYSGALCYQAIGGLLINFNGTTHFQYIVSNNMTFYLLSLSIKKLMIAKLGEAYMQGCYGALLLSNSYFQHNPVVFQKLVSGSGNFDLRMPRQGNPYEWGLVVPPFGNPTATITISPVLGTYTIVMTLTSWTPIAITTSGTVTFTSSSVLQVQVPFIQAYGGWIVAGVIIAVLAADNLLLSLKRRVKPKNTDYLDDARPADGFGNG